MADEEKKEGQPQTPSIPDTTTTPTKLSIAYKETILDTEQANLNPLLDRRLNRKFDLHILPWLFGIWQAPLPPPFLSSPHPPMSATNTI